MQDQLTECEGYSNSRGLFSARKAIMQYDQLKGIRCPSTIRQQGMSCTSCPDAIAKVLAKVDRFIRENTTLSSILRQSQRPGSAARRPAARPRPDPAAAMCLPRRRRYISAPNAAAPWSMREAVSSAATAVSPNADKDASA